MAVHIVFHWHFAHPPNPHGHDPHLSAKVGAARTRRVPPPEARIGRAVGAA